MTFTREALAGLLPPHHLGVPCGYCNARPQVPCRNIHGKLLTKAHAARERRAWHVRHWLYLHSIDANKARP